MRTKLMEEIITSKDFDFIAIRNNIDQFGKKYLLSPKSVHNMQVVFEELCVQTLLPYQGEAPHLQFKIEYSDKTNSTQIRIAYSGKAFELEEDMDMISFALLKNATTSINTALTENGENEFILDIK